MVPGHSTTAGMGTNPANADRELHGFVCMRMCNCVRVDDNDHVYFCLTIQEIACF